jgi:hypothetical protein
VPGTYAVPGNYQVAVRVIDDDGAATTDVAQVAINHIYQIYLPMLSRNR